MGMFHQAAPSPDATSIKCTGAFLFYLVPAGRCGSIQARGKHKHTFRWLLDSCGCRGFWCFVVWCLVLSDPPSGPATQGAHRRSFCITLLPMESIIPLPMVIALLQCFRCLA